MRFRFRDEAPWEVVDQAQVEPVFMYDDAEDFDISSVSQGDMCGTYVFDLKKSSQLRNVLVFSRQLLLKELAKEKFNVLISEGWQLTLSRKGKKKYRAEVRYSGRAAHVLGKLPEPHPPPFLVLLDNCRFT